MNFKRVLAIETSCDDTSVAIVLEDGTVEAVLSANQDKAHAPFGGIVPELASRNHTLHLLPQVEEVLHQACRDWKDIDGIVVTSRPGLIGSLLVGVVTAKTLALTKDKPFIGVNHLEGHLLAPFLRDEGYAPPEQFGFPFIALAVSGGHTQLYKVQAPGQYQVLGRTLDDAAGEAFDKFAKLMGLGFPGGVQVDRLSQGGDPHKYLFPRALLKEENLNYSFSGLKTAAQNLLRKMSDEEKRNELPHLCASYQEAIVEALLAKLDRAIDKTALQRAILTGGVSANSRLRVQAEKWAQQKGVQIVTPPLRYCTDNAAMIGYAGLLRLQRGERSDQSLGPLPRPQQGDFIEL